MIIKPLALVYMVLTEQMMGKNGSVFKLAPLTRTLLTPAVSKLAAAFED
jgi:hypothetical protein